MSELSMKAIFTRKSAAPIHAAAMGAAILAKTAGKSKLSEECMVVARQMRSVVRYGQESHPVNAFGIAPIPATDVPAPFAAVAKEIARTGKWVGDSMLIGYVKRSDGGGRRLYAKAHGKGVAYLAEPDVKPKAERAAEEKAKRADVVAKEKTRLAEQKKQRAARKVESEPVKAESTAAPTTLTPIKAAELSKEITAKAAEMRREGTPDGSWLVGEMDYDGGRVQVFMKKRSNSVRYSITAV